MKGVVLAAGEGTRMRPLADDRPKGLVEVAGQPLVSHTFDALVDLGVDALVVVVGHRAAELMKHFDDAYRDVPITYVHQRERLGLAHAVCQARPHVDDDFLVMNGDNVCRANLAAVVDRHREADADATVLIDEVTREEARETGVFELDDDGEVVGVVEKPDDPPSTSVPRGFYAFSPVVFHACELVRPGDTGERELSAAIDLLVAAGRPVETVPLDGWCENVNTPEDRDAVAERLASE